ncbi:hypothetical protein BDZ85DRAFT_94005 [Elsinoe ampelina]|uniref:Uncharacterized protein n=1 Tax=Elsinoe ampelina TaxID=302913 RepID=A0A6A6FYD7_9PEZI|nr:hypothetical protein BDZ85DRAFT_94005 [Elsinoe ampelina]
MQEESSETDTTARAVVCSENAEGSIKDMWTGDFGLTRWIILRHDGTGVLLGGRQFILDISMDFKWQVLDSGFDQPFHLGPTIPRTPILLAEFRLQLDFDATTPGAVKLDGKDTITERRTGPFKQRDPGPRVFAVRLERGYFTPKESSSGLSPCHYELRLVFEPSPYGTKQEWDGIDDYMETDGYWDDKAFVARQCPSPPAGILPHIQDNCVVS